MEKKKLSVWSSGLIWFGAGVSIAEIFTGTLIAPLGFTKGLLAILLGHVIGCMLFYFAGLIGAKSKKSAMETVKLSFGQKGSLLFSSANVLQLVGWTAVMVVSGAAAAEILLPFGRLWLWCAILGALVLFWLVIGVTRLGKLHIVVMSALFVLTIVLSVIVFQGGTAPAVSGGISFGAAVELSAAMPLSWLPLISDYTRYAEKEKAATFTSTAVYFLVSSWMYVIGMGAALFTGEGDVALIMLRAGMGVLGLLVVLFSTVTTTFMDAYSAGVSSVSICGKWREKTAAIAVCVLGTVLAIATPITQYENFLYLIGSIFAPMVAILITDYFILHKDKSAKAFSWTALALWAVGFTLYRFCMQLETPLGNTLPVMLVTAALYYLVSILQRRSSHAA